MATLAYPVAQSTTSTLFGPMVGPSFGNSKPTGQSFNVLSNILWGIVLDQNKLNGISVRATTFVPLQIPLDTAKLSAMEVSSAWNQVDTAKLAASKWIPENVTLDSKTNSNLSVSVGTSYWSPLYIGVDNIAIDVMTTGNVYAGVLVTPYLYDSFTTGSMILVNNTTIGIPDASATPTIHSYNEKMLTLNTGCVLAYGELQRNNGWSA